MCFFLKDDNVLDKYKYKFYSMPLYDKTYIKAKVREFGGEIKTIFLGNKVPKENMYYTFIACIAIDSVMTMKKLFSFLFIRYEP